MFEQFLEPGGHPSAASAWGDRDPLRAAPAADARVRPPESLAPLDEMYVILLNEKNDIFKR